jgi:hypothetical protein
MRSSSTTSAAAGKAGLKNNSGRNGGPRPNAGRPKGSRNKFSKLQAERAYATGETPLEYMLAVMRNPRASSRRRDEMARAAAPYVHPKLQAILASTSVPDRMSNAEYAAQVEAQLAELFGIEDEAQDSSQVA